MSNSPERIIVAMSGGVDSSVAAALLVEQGYDVVAMTMRVASGEGRLHSDKACCTLDAAHDAKRVADKLGIPHYTINYLERFEREVISDFTNEYLAGRTPNPCSRCNQRVKFGALYEKAIAIGADLIATGHYVRRIERDGRVALRRGVDSHKDQSYTLAGLSQDQLRRARFPIGELTKAETREHAQRLELVTWDKPESQEICFVPNDNYRDFLASRVGAPKKGRVVNTDGDVLGEHHGLMFYTVGQRRGLGIAAPEPLYVLRLDVPNNTLVVGTREETYCNGMTVGELCWSGLAEPAEPFDCTVQIRAHHDPVRCTVTPNGATAQVEFLEPVDGVSPGQWGVFYDDDTVLAGGVIDAYALVGETASAT
jgi:tRNA-uridine 2-sulfurtransferase